MPVKKSPAVVRSHTERESLFNQHEKLAYAARHTWVRKNSTFVNRYRLEMDDLDSVALLALWYATEIWNPAKGKFSTIATLAVYSRLGHVLTDLSRQKAGGGSLPALSLDAPVTPGSFSPARFVDRLPIPLDEQPERAVLRSAESAALWKAVDDLSEAQQEVLRLRYQDDLKLLEVAERVGMPRTAVSARLAAGLSRLRQVLTSDEPDRVKGDV